MRSSLGWLESESELGAHGTQIEQGISRRRGMSFFLSRLSLYCRVLVVH